MPSPSSIFHRRVKQDGELTLIESICLKCGTIKVGSVADGLPYWERQHERECAERRNFLQRLIPGAARRRAA